jgi:tetratricopeptide (TPR) repeat protein
MTEPHPDREALERFLDDELDEPAGRLVQRHLLSCPACEERLIHLLPRPLLLRPRLSSGSARVPEEPGDPDRLRLRLAGAGEGLAGRLAAERLSAGERWEELRAESQARRHALLQEEPRYRTWGLFELLIEKARHAVLTEPQQAEEILHLALDLAGRLDASTYGPEAMETAKARAWAYLGNALRVRWNFRGAEQAFQAAEKHLAKSWLDPLDEALLLELEASLRRAQRRYDEALELLRRAIEVYREVHEPHLQGRALLAQGLVLQYRQDYEAACASFHASLFLLDGLEDPRLVAIGEFNLVNCLHESGKTVEAAALLPETRQLMERSGTRSDLVRLLWLEGRIAAVICEAGQAAAAERALVETREAWIEIGSAFDAALASLDLAALYARQGRVVEARGLVEEILPIFRSCKLHGEALAALIVFQQATELEQLSFGLVEEVASFLRQVRNNPGLRFRGGERPPQEGPGLP